MNEIIISKSKANRNERESELGHKWSQVGYLIWKIVMCHSEEFGLGKYFSNWINILKKNWLKLAILE